MDGVCVCMLECVCVYTCVHAEAQDWHQKSSPIAVYLVSLGRVSHGNTVLGAWLV